MPNHVDNCVTVIGAPARVDEIRAWLRGKAPRTGDSPTGLGGFTNHNYTSREEWERKPDEEFCFHKIIPLPEAYSKVPYGDDSRNNGCEIENETWGMKWGAYATLPVIADPGILTYRFETAWVAPNRKIMPALTHKWRDLHFVLSWGGEGPTRGMTVSYDRLTIGGEESYERYKDEYPPFDEDDEDESFRREALITHKKRGEHLRKCVTMYCELRGFRFDDGTPDAVLADYIDEHFGWASHAERLRRASHWYED